MGVPWGFPLCPAALLALYACHVASVPSAPFSLAPWPDSSPSRPAAVGGSPSPFSGSGGSPSSSPIPPSPSQPSATNRKETPGQPLRGATPGDDILHRTPGAAMLHPPLQEMLQLPGVEMVVLVERVERKGWPGEPRSMAGARAMSLFLGACGLLLCLLAGVYCAYCRAARKELFTHHRLQDATFDDLALHLEAPKVSYDWFYYDTEYEVPPPAPCLPVQAQAQPQVAPTLLPACPVLLKPPKDETLGPSTQEQPKLRPLKLESLSPASLPQGNDM